MQSVQKNCECSAGAPQRCCEKLSTPLLQSAVMNRIKFFTQRDRAECQLRIFGELNSCYKLVEGKRGYKFSYRCANTWLRCGMPLRTHCCMKLATYLCIASYRPFQP
jgi:hypothetical protein